MDSHTLIDGQSDPLGSLGEEESSAISINSPSVTGVQ